MAYQLVRLMPECIRHAQNSQSLLRVRVYKSTYNKNMRGQCARGGETKADVFAFITKKVNSLEVHSSLPSHSARRAACV